MKYSERVYKDLEDMYAGLWEDGYWINPDGNIPIRQMSKKHIKSVINMLKTRSSSSLEYLKSRKNKDDILNECIELIELKIEEFEDHLERNDYDKYY